MEGFWKSQGIDMIYAGIFRDSGQSRILRVFKTCTGSTISILGTKSDTLTHKQRLPPTWGSGRNRSKNGLSRARKSAYGGHIFRLMVCCLQYLYHTGLTTHHQSNMAGPRPSSRLPGRAVSLARGQNLVANFGAWEGSDS